MAEGGLQTMSETAESLKTNLDSIISKINSLGLSVHLQNNKSILFPSNSQELQILHGEEALKHFNRPEWSDKVLAFGSKIFYCHSEYLRVRSEYFEALFAGVYQETTMNLINVELPASSSNVEMLLKYLYTGEANERLFYGIEIFKTIENGNYLGAHDLVSLAVEAFAVRWKSLVLLKMFRRSIVDVRFVRALLRYGSKKGLIKNSEKLKIIVHWSAKSDSDISEARSLILESKCLDEASFADVQWSIEEKPDLLIDLRFANFIDVFQRASKEKEEVEKIGRDADIKSKGLLECVRLLTKQLEEVRCTKCQMLIPRVSMKTRTCVVMGHPGVYTLYQGWSCCKQLKKSPRVVNLSVCQGIPLVDRGCKPFGVSRHTIG